MFAKTKTILYQALHLSRKAPVNADRSEVPAFFKEIKTEQGPVYLYKYDHVNVTPEGIVFRNFKKDPDLLIYPQHTRIYNWLYLCSSLIKRKRIDLSPDESYLLCFDYWSNSIFHWMCDALPRLEAVKDLAKDCIFLLPEFYSYPYILETLQAFQFKGIYRVKDSEYLHCAHLYAPAQITTSGQMRPENILSLRKTLLDHFKPAFSGELNYANVYISRSKARFRKVLNETELLPVLKKHGYTLIHFEDLSVAQQIELCYNATKLVSIHGANLTNSIFLQPGSRVLELRKRGDVQNNYYYELADSVNCRYFCLDCEFEDPEPHKNTFSLHVNTQQFDQALEKLAHG